MERRARKLLFEHFQNNLLISVWQTVFIPGTSTVTNLVEMYHTIFQAVSPGKEVRVLGYHAYIFILPSLAFVYKGDCYINQ